MLDLLKQNKFLLIIVGIIIAGVAWFGLSGSEPTENSILETETIGGADSARERELLGTLAELRAIRLDGQIFSNPAFTSLRDFGQEIISEPIGRDNPFAPLGSTSGDDVDTQEGAGATQQ